MSKINWEVRLKNKWFIIQVVLSIMTPILAYMGISPEQLNSWDVLGKTMLDAISNPYIVGLVLVSIFNALTDPTTHGIKDHEEALTYKVPLK